MVFILLRSNLYSGVYLQTPLRIMSNLLLMFLILGLESSPYCRVLVQEPSFPVPVQCYPGNETPEMALFVVFTSILRTSRIITTLVYQKCLSGSKVSSGTYLTCSSFAGIIYVLIALSESMIYTRNPCDLDSRDDLFRPFHLYVWTYSVNETINYFWTFTE